jgi:hypothetical protein
MDRGGDPAGRRSKHCVETTVAGVRSFTQLAPTHAAARRSAALSFSKLATLDWSCLAALLGCRLAQALDFVSAPALPSDWRPLTPLRVVRWRSVFLSSLRSLRKTGAPDRIRTCDLCLRRAALYPAELRAPTGRPIKQNEPATQSVVRLEWHFSTSQALLPASIGRCSARCARALSGDRFRAREISWMCSGVSADFS